jgi:Pyruvate/2-oxoacid:ferredoxin oxidoreductase delta subunit
MSAHDSAGADDLERPRIIPYKLLDNLIRDASARFLTDACTCREERDCPSFPSELGCLVLGEGNVASGDVREVTVEEALERTARARELMLSARIAYDSSTLAIHESERGRMLPICFSCTCCCPATAPKREQDNDDGMRLPELWVRAVGDCSTCEKCARSCPSRALVMGPDGPIFAPSCKGCGLCAAACPRRNIRIGLPAASDAMRFLLSRSGATGPNS